MAVTASEADVGRNLRSAAAHLFTNAGLTSSLGVAYWVAAARLLSPTEVGRGSALISLIMTLSAFAQLNFNVSLSRILPRDMSRAPGVLARVYALTGGVSLIAGASFGVIAPHISDSFRYAEGAPYAPLLLGLAVAVWTIFSLEDSALASLRRTRIIPVENAVFGVLKLVVLAALVAVGVATNSIVVSWIAPLLLIVGAVNLYLFIVALPHPEAIGEKCVSAIGRLGRAFAAYDYVGSLAWLAGTLAVPVVVAASIGAAREASFYVPYTVAVSLDVVAINLGNALTAEVVGGRDHDAQRASIARFLQRYAALLCFLVLIGIAAAPVLLSAFGSHYRHTGLTTMQLMMLAVIPRGALFIGLAVARSRSRGGTIVAGQTLTSTITVALGITLLPGLGVVGMAAAWLAGSTCGALLVTIRATLPFLRTAG